MKIKSSGNKKKELAFLIGGSVMIALLVFYLIFLINSIASRANVIFGNPNTTVDIASFDFERYNRIVTKIFPSSTIDRAPEIE